MTSNKDEVTKHNKLRDIKKAIEYLSEFEDDSTHYKLAVEALKLLEALSGDVTPHRAAMMQALGWCYANVCIMLDNGEDPRTTEMIKVVEQFETDFKFDDEIIIVPH